MKGRVNQSGKISFSTILITVILFYGAFVTYKLISSSLTKAQIKNEIIDKFGYIRGAEFTAEKGENAIRDILIDHGLYYDPIDEENANLETNVDEDNRAENTDVVTGTQIQVDVLQRGSKVHFNVQYSDIVDLILLKVKPRYTIDYEMLNYN